jgi:hypothetical protein
MLAYYNIIPRRGAEIPVTLKSVPGAKFALLRKNLQNGCTTRYISSWNMELTPS